MWVLDELCPDCGAGLRLVEGGYEMRPHSMECATLKKMSELHRQGICSSCGERYFTEANGEIWYCPNGHTRGMQGNALLDFFDATGAGWIRDAVEQPSS